MNARITIALMTLALAAGWMARDAVNTSRAAETAEAKSDANGVTLGDPNEPKLKYPWASAEWSQLTRETAMDRQIWAANRVKAEPCVLSGSKRRPTIVGESFHAAVDANGITLTVSVKARKGVKPTDLACKTAYRTWLRNIFLPEDSPNFRAWSWPVLVKLASDGKTRYSAQLNGQDE